MEREDDASPTISMERKDCQPASGTEEKKRRSGAYIRMAEEASYTVSLGEGGRKEDVQEEGVGD